jgi:hypothetical protein
MKVFNSKNLIAATALILLAACGGDNNNSDSVSADSTSTEMNDPNKSNLIEVEGQVFSIPSPVQTALLIKEVGTTYNKDILNDPKKATNYTTSAKKALNLGVYGADLGYVTIYDQTQDAISYLTSIKTMADELGVTSAFDLTLMERFEKNMGNQDTLLALVSDAYRAADDFLKNNERNDVAALILAGGWVESLFFALDAANKTKNKEIIRRVGEQKNTLSNLIKILQPYYSKPEVSELVDELNDLKTIYDQVEITYEYQEPITDAQNRITTITSKTDVKISDEQLNAISEKINVIRENLIK